MINVEMLKFYKYMSLGSFCLWDPIYIKCQLGPYRCSYRCYVQPILQLKYIKCINTILLHLKVHVLPRISAPPFSQIEQVVQCCCLFFTLLIFMKCSVTGFRLCAFGRGIYCDRSMLIMCLVGLNSCGVEGCCRYVMILLGFYY